jgi:hypothetical protein
MSFHKTVSLLILSFFIFSSNGANAEDKWWEKAIALIKPENQINPFSQPNISEINLAFKEALRIAAETTVSQLSRPDGFNGDPAVHISLPKTLNSVKKVLSKVGMGELVDDLELKLNRAGEAAAPKARKLLLQSIQEMKFEDVKRIYRGPPDSATQYFKAKMSRSLRMEISPIIATSLSSVGAVKAFDRVMHKYQDVPFVPDISADLTNHVIAKAMDGIYHHLAKQEAAIRQNPSQQTTALLKKVFAPR